MGFTSKENWQWSEITGYIKQQKHRLKSEQLSTVVSLKGKLKLTFVLMILATWHIPCFQLKGIQLFSAFGFCAPGRSPVTTLL